ncbi:MAG: MFS transporter [Butyrivibrio sp.]|uniref:MFS transporter n=1 Tax=Butyrivibrio sp. TaxID=28121 RepID=UPI001B2B088A|nr:MFS transporter [Butyrivibrio sp.]MBO6241144.1 MFS transporter [Butyrivibrio sp.]
MENKKSIYKEIFREEKYIKLLLANFIDRFGDSVDAIAFTWIIYQITGSAAWSALVFALNYLPNVLVQPLAGALIEKLDKKKVVVTTYFLRAAILSSFILIYKLGMATPIIFAIFTLAITTVESFNLPASTAFSAQTIEKEHMTNAMSINTIFSKAATLVGTGIAGVIITVFGADFAMTIDLSSYLISAVLIALIKEKKEVSPTTDKAQKHSQGAIQEFIVILKDGFQYVLKTKAVKNFCVLCVALNFMLVPLDALQAPIAGDIFGMGSELLSFAGVLSSIGGIIGAAILPYVLRKLTPLWTTISGMVVLTIGVALVPLGKLVSGNEIYCYAMLGTSFFLMLVAVSLIGGTLSIQFMKSVETEYMARASAVFNASATAAMPIGSLLVSALVAKVGTLNMMIVCTAFVFAVLVAVSITKPDLEIKENLDEAA